MIGSLAITEPGGGSDVAGSAPPRYATATTTSSTARRPSSPRGIRADFVTTAVRTGGPGHAGISLLVVENGMPGFTVDRIAAQDGLALLRHRRAVVRRRAGPRRQPDRRENAGFAQIAQQFVVERIALAVHAYGIAARSLELTAEYCRSARRSASR